MKPGSADTKQFTIPHDKWLKQISRRSKMTPDITIKTTTATTMPATIRTTTAKDIKSTTATATTTTISTNMKRHLLTIEKLRNRVRQILKCVINLHIDILVLESNVSQLIDDCKELNSDLMEVQRLDNLIQTLRDYNGPTICHEWPFPLVYQGTIDEAEIAQTLNTNEIFTSV